MTPPETIRVTAAHIADGIAQDCEDCPIALAIIEQWDGPINRYDIGVDNREVLVIVRKGPGISHDQTFTAGLPPAACDFIARFDVGEPVEPFEFDLEWTVTS